MNAFIIEFPSLCLTALLEGYSACGVELLYSGRLPAHYSGNFWWADCSHVAALPGLWDPINNAYSCEHVLFNVSTHNHHRMAYVDNCGYNMFNCMVNHYQKPCPRYRYIHRIEELLTATPLLPSPGRTVQWSPRRCKEAHQVPFMQHPSWWDKGKTWWGDD